MSDFSEEFEMYATDIQQQVLARSETEGEEEFAENIFTQMMMEVLGDAGELEDTEMCPYRATGIQVSAWGISGDDECLDLLVTFHTGETPPRTVTQTEMNAHFKRLKEFAAKAMGGFCDKLEESSQVFDAAYRIYEIKENLTRIRFFLLTDGIVKADAPPASDMDRWQVTYQVWDLERFYRLASSGRQQEPIEIDFEAVAGAPIPCLAQPASSPDYAAYLAIIPGPVLAKLYGDYGSRLLERNVRSFLQARGKINMGIRRTILKEPHMFLAYNNGLSATAESVEIAELPGGGVGIKSIKDFQVVNGGQTTASIFHALKRDKADLSALFVQAKLTVIREAQRMDDIVPLISEYANSQNKVQTADFAANDVYHREMERLSRTIWAPAREGTQRQTHWYYERARGQYQDDLARERTPGRQKDFKTINPTTQLFTKTDLAKFIQTWSQRPHIVSRGAQFCFNDFRSKLEEHQAAEGQLGEHYFEALAAKAILFHSAERIIKAMGYPGYRANLITYTLARLSHDTKGRIDLDRIWREQKLSIALEGAIADVCKHTWNHITTASGSGNVTQYCKQEACWSAFLQHPVPVPWLLASELKETGADSAAVVVKDKRPECVKKVAAISPDIWFDVASWGQRTGLISGLDVQIATAIATDLGYGKEPSPKQSTAGWKLIEDARRQGYRG